MRITFSIDKDLARDVRKIAVGRGTTLTALVRSHLRELADEHAQAVDQKAKLEALKRSFEELRVNIGYKAWTREELYERPSNRASQRESE